MAHQTRADVDTAAAAAAAAIAQEPTPESTAETTLAYGAQGECVTKLVDVLALLGYATNDVVRGGPPVLDESVLVDVRAAQAALEVIEPALTTAAEIPVGVSGELVGQATWTALYNAAESKLEAEATTGTPATATGTPGA